MPVIKEAVRAGRIPDVPTSAAAYPVYAIGIPREPIVAGKYEAIELLQNVYIETTEEDRRRFSFVLGRLSSDHGWEIISAAVLTDDGTWRTISVDGSTGT